MCRSQRLGKQKKPFAYPGLRLFRTLPALTRILNFGARRCLSTDAAGACFACFGHQADVS